MAEVTPNIFVCETNSMKCISLEEEIVKMMKSLQTELNKYEFKAVIISIIKDSKSNII